jgi:hypothetical protein
MSSESKQPLSCRKEGTLVLKDPNCPEPVKPLIERLVRILPARCLELAEIEYRYWKWADRPHYTVKVELHADVDLLLDTDNLQCIRVKFRNDYEHKDEEVKALLETLYCRPAVEFFQLLMKVQADEWDWRGPPEKLKAKRTEEKVYCEYEIGDFLSHRLEIPNDKYDRALAALNSIGLEEADWVVYGSYYESGHLEHTAAWGMLDVEARGDGTLWYKSLKYDFDSRAWIPVKDGPTLRGIIEAQKNMTFVDFYDKYLTFPTQGTTGAEGPPMSAAAAP